MDLKHKATVNKIKSEIWGDRLSFLQKMVKLSDESKQDMDGQPAAKSTSSAPKGQALA